MSDQYETGYVRSTRPARLHSFIPAYYYEAQRKELILALAKERGYSPEDIEKLRFRLYEMRAPVLVRIDDEGDE